MRTVLIFALFALSGCFTGTERGPADPALTSTGPVPDNQIVVYRSAEMGLVSTVTTGPAILLDGRTIGTCRIGQPLVLQVPNGSWTITALAAGGQVTREVEVANGERRNLRCGTTSVPASNPAPTLVPVGTEIALEEAGL